MERIVELLHTSELPPDAQVIDLGISVPHQSKCNSPFSASIFLFLIRSVPLLMIPWVHCHHYRNDTDNNKIVSLALLHHKFQQIMLSDS